MDEPTEITIEDIERAVEYLNNLEIKENTCFKCSKKYYGNSYGNHISECDECWFSRFPEEEVEVFYRSFFE